MIKAFLSHSSSDKNHFVRLVADKLKNNYDIIYDEYTFEAGNKTIDEIFSNLNKTDLFVFFISENSLNSDWVKEEIFYAKNIEQKIKQFYPIIIDKNITYKDIRIPKWLKKAYNLKLVTKPTVVARRIEQKIREISLNKHPKLKMKNDLCIGRNTILEEFEERIDNYEKKKPKCIFTTGLSSIGRRTFLKHALKKTNLIDEYYNPNSMYLDNNDSIEDFIFKLNDFGFLDINEELTDLLSKNLEFKIELVIKILKEIELSSELIIILDNGCIINYERKISEWFKKVIDSPVLKNNVLICTASKYKVDFTQLRDDNFYSIHVNDLTISERKRLFNRLLEIYDLEIQIDDFNLLCSNFYGFPEQILYCVDYISRTNIQVVKNNLRDIREFNDEKASALIKHYNENDEILSIIRLIAQFEIISLDFISNIVKIDSLNIILDKLVTESICEFFGYDGEFIRVNDSIRDYIIRNRLEIKKEYTLRIKEHVEDFIKSDDIQDKDSSDYLFSIKEALLEGKEIEDNLLLPSHFLRTMKDFYHKGIFQKVIQLADKVLEKEQYMDPYLANDIKYYLCLALAKKRDTRVLKEVQKLNGDQHNFILGYYYRLIGKYSQSLDKLNSIINSRYIQSRAKREITNVYIQTEGYSKALNYAKENYIENKNNIYHIQLYFYCLIYSDKYYEHKDELLRISKELKKLSDEVNIDMGERAEALYLAKCENNENKSLSLINETIYKFNESHYPLLTKFDIALKFYNIEEMKDAIEKLESFNNIKSISEKTYIKQKAYYIAIAEQNSTKAKQLIYDELKNYPQESKDLILSKIDQFVSLNKLPD